MLLTLLKSKIHRLTVTLQFDNEDRNRIRRIPRIDRRLGRFDGEPVHDLHGPRQKPRCYHPGDGVTRRCDAGVGSE